MTQSNLTIEEVAQLLRVSTKTIHRLISKGELAAFKVGAQVRVKRSELVAYQAKNKIQPSARGQGQE
jgi:putative molybdopterin biosynthesis protein